MRLRKKQNRRVFAWLSDTHGGKTTGLLNPATVLLRVDDGGEIEPWKPELSTTQGKLWLIYENAIGELEEYAKDDEILVAHDGDITHGDKHNGHIPETTLEDQRIIACDNMRPLVSLKNVSKVRLLTGTEVHVPECAEARVAAKMRKEFGLDVSCSHHTRFDMGGDIIEGTHHGPHPGSRDWLRGNTATYYLKDRIYTDRRVGVKPARAFMRGHYHRHVHVSIHECWQGEHTDHELIIIPALAGLDGFIRKVGQSPPILQAGIIALEFIDGYLSDIKPFTDELDLRTEERL